jgi:hypothetical protein
MFIIAMESWRVREKWRQGILEYMPDIQLAYNGFIDQKRKDHRPSYLGGGLFIAWTLFVH